VDFNEFALSKHKKSNIRLNRREKGTGKRALIGTLLLG